MGHGTGDGRRRAALVSAANGLSQRYWKDRRFDRRDHVSLALLSLQHDAGSRSLPDDFFSLVKKPAGWMLRLFVSSVYQFVIRSFGQGGVCLRVLIGHKSPPSDQ